MVHFRFLVSVFLERALNFLSDLMTSSILFLSAWPLPCERCGETEEFVTGRQGLVVGSVCLFCKELKKLQPARYANVRAKEAMTLSTSSINGYFGLKVFRNKQGLCIGVDGHELRFLKQLNGV